MGTKLNNRITILMATHNGAKYLIDQFDSIRLQDFSAWRLIISDDNSTDGTRALIRSYINDHPNLDIKFVEGSGRGFCFNFFSMLGEVSTEYFCFCDQDDIWLPNKLTHSIKILEQYDCAALCCSPTIIVDFLGNRIGTSPLFRRKPSFKNALVQSLAGGNTMVFNSKALEILKLAYDPSHIPISHDWWCYQVISGIGGTVHYDTKPLVKYRQHSGNLIGSNMSFNQRIKRLMLLLKGRYRDWTDVNLEALQASAPLLEPNNAEILDKFIQLRHEKLFTRIHIFNELGLYRQTSFGNAALFAACILKRI